MNAVEREEKSARIAARVASLGTFEKAKHVLVFLSMPDEIQTGRILETAWELGKSVYVPLVNRGEPDLQLGQLKPGDVLDKGPMGIPQPRISSQDLSSPELLDCLLLPGLAFDGEGARIGYGAGYFDRFLKKTTAARIALAFDFQILESVPQTENDEAVEWIVTESRVVQCQHHSA